MIEVVLFALLVLSLLWGVSRRAQADALLAWAVVVTLVLGFTLLQTAGVQ